MFFWRCLVQVGVTPLHMAARHGQLQAVQFLLDRAADLHLPSMRLRPKPRFLAQPNGYPRQRSMYAVVSQIAESYRGSNF